MKDFKIALFFDDSKHNFIGCHNIPHLIPILVQTNPKLSLDNEDVKAIIRNKEMPKPIKYKILGK